MSPLLDTLAKVAQEWNATLEREATEHPPDAEDWEDDESDGEDGGGDGDDLEAAWEDESEAEELDPEVDYSEDVQPFRVGSALALPRGRGCGRHDLLMALDAPAPGRAWCPECRVATDYLTLDPVAPLLLPSDVLVGRLL